MGPRAQGRIKVIPGHAGDGLGLERFAVKGSSQPQCFGVKDHVAVEHQFPARFCELGPVEGGPGVAAAHVLPGLPLGFGEIPEPEEVLPAAGQKIARGIIQRGGGPGLSARASGQEAALSTRIAAAEERNIGAAALLHRHPQLALVVVFVGGVEFGISQAAQVPPGQRISQVPVGLQIPSGGVLGVHGGGAEEAHGPGNPYGQNQQPCHGPADPGRSGLAPQQRAQHQQPQGQQRRDRRQNRVLGPVVAPEIPGRPQKQRHSGQRTGQRQLFHGHPSHR